jgi:hypothetical protein
MSLIEGHWMKRPNDITAHFFAKDDPFGSMCGVEASDKGMQVAGECESILCERCKEDLGEAEWYERILRAPERVRR